MSEKPTGKLAAFASNANIKYKIYHHGDDWMLVGLNAEYNRVFSKWRADLCVSLTRVMSACPNGLQWHVVESAQP